MKKIIILILITIIILIAGAAIFIATFDINQYNKSITSQIEAIVGNPVKIERLMLGWKGGILLGIEKFQVFTEKDGQMATELSFARGDMALEFWPLLKKQIKVSSITIMRPSIHLAKLKDGTIKVFGYTPKNAPAPRPAAAKAGKAAAMPIAIDFNIRSIVIRNGTLHFQDFSGEPPADISIDTIDADIKNVSLNTPIDFIIKMAFLSLTQNVNISGTTGGFVTGPMYVKDLNLDVDLGTINHAKLIQALPLAGKMGIGEEIKGILKAKVPQITLVDNKISKLEAELMLSDGKFSVTQFKIPIERVNFSAIAQDDRLSLRSFSAQLANATVGGSADVSSIYTIPETSMNVKAQIPGVKQYLQSVVGGTQYLDGKIGLSFDGTMTGLSEEEISKSLSGNGVFTLDNGVLLDTNLIRQSLGGIAIIPGLLDAISMFLPAAAKEALNRQYTLLKPIHQSITVKDGLIDLPDLKFETDFADVKGAAQLTLGGTLTGNGTISFAPLLSDAIIKGVPEMRYLSGRDNLIEFPVTFKSSGKGISVMPDLKYIGTKVAAKKGEEMVGDLLNKAIGTNAPSQPEAMPVTPDKSSTGVSDIMEGLKSVIGQ